MLPLAISFRSRQSVAVLFDLALGCDSKTDFFLSFVIEGDKIEDGERPDQQKNDEKRVTELGSRLDECDRSSRLRGDNKPCSSVGFYSFFQCC